MEKELKKPTTQNLVPAFDLSKVLASVRKRASQDQAQDPVSELASQIGKHLRAGFLLVVFPVKLLDGVGELSVVRQLNTKDEQTNPYCGDVRDVVCRERCRF